MALKRSDITHQYDKHADTVIRSQVCVDVRGHCYSPESLDRYIRLNEDAILATVYGDLPERLAALRHRCRCECASPETWEEIDREFQRVIEIVRGEG